MWKCTLEVQKGVYIMLKYWRLQGNLYSYRQFNIDFQQNLHEKDNSNTESEYDFSYHQIFRFLGLNKTKYK